MSAPMTPQETDVWRFQYALRHCARLDADGRRSWRNNCVLGAVRGEREVNAYLSGILCFERELELRARALAKGQELGVGAAVRIRHLTRTGR